MKNSHPALLCVCILLIIACGNNKNTTGFNQPIDSALIGLSVEDAKQDTSLVKDSLLIEAKEFYGIKPQDNLNTLKAKYKNQLVKAVEKTGEGDFNIYKLLDEDGKLLANIYPDQKNNAMVGQIEIHSLKAKTKEGIKIGDSYKNLLDTLKQVEVHGSEVEGQTYAAADNIYFKLDMRHFSYELDPKTIKPEVKITEIVIR